MSVEVIAIGGYQEVGKNMTAVRIGDDVVIFDMGIHLDRISMHEDTDIDRMHSLDLIERGVIPDDTLMKDVDGKVKGIVFSHGHLDHIGAVAKLAHRYDAPLIGTPYTAALIEKQIKGERKFKVSNPIKVLNPGSKVKLSKDITLEFVQSTHSIPQAVFPVLHTPEGVIVYALDFKFDNHQKVSPPPDYKRLKELGKKGVLALIVETTNAKNFDEVKTHSERIAKNILEDVMRGPLYEKTGMIVTTFSSHVERVQAIADIAKKSHREIFFLGRSMERFCGIAQKLGILKLPENASIYGSPKAVNKALMKADEDRANYIKKGDNVIISAPIIPNPTNAANRHIMERRLKVKGARIYPNAHVSGHAGREDHREFLRMLKPQHIIPAHGDLSMLAAYAELAEEEGYRIGYDIHILRNAQAQVFRS